MNFKRVICSIGLLSIAFFGVGAVSAMERPARTERPGATAPQIQGGTSFESSGEDNAGGVSITNDISVKASTGGNSANGAQGQSGGSVTTGSAKAEVKVETKVNGETVVDIDEAYEGEAEIEKEFENASGTVKTKIKAEVRSATTTATTSATVGALVKKAEKKMEKEVWYLRMWPFGKDDKENDAYSPISPQADEEEEDAMLGTSSPRGEIGATFGATSTATDSTSSPQAATKSLSTGRNIREAVRSFIRNLFSMFGF